MKRRKTYRDRIDSGITSPLATPLQTKAFTRKEIDMGMDHWSHRHQHFFNRLRALPVWAITASVGFQVTQNVSAQPASGIISGLVRDSSCAGVAGAQLSIRNLTNDRTFSASTDASGAYRIQNLSAGSYEITASKYGFVASKARIATDARHPARLDLRMKLADIAGEAPPSDSKKREALEQRIDQLEAGLRKKNNEAAPAQSPQVPHGLLVATQTSEQNQIPATPGTLPPPDLSKAVAVNANPTAAPAPQRTAMANPARQNQAPAAPQQKQLMAEELAASGSPIFAGAKPSSASA